MGSEYRVVWRREHDKTKRTKIYQTLRGAEDWAHFLRVSSWDEADLDDWRVENLKKLGDPVDVAIDVREVSEWARLDEEEK